MELCFDAMKLLTFIHLGSFSFLELNLNSQRSVVVELSRDETTGRTSVSDSHRRASDDASSLDNPLNFTL